MRNLNTTVLYAVGDVGIQRVQPETLFDRVRPVLKEADILFGNLESAPSEKGSVVTKGSPVRSPKNSIDAIVSAGFKVMSVANNHFMDHGVEGMRECLNSLDKSGIAYAGAGNNAEEALRPAIVEHNGIRIAFIACNYFFPNLWSISGASKIRPGVAPIFTEAELDPPHVYLPHLEAVKAQVAKARSQADLVIASTHGGLSWIHAVVSYQKAINHAMIDAGADLVLGHHPHILQAIEVYKGKVICYSLAEFGLELPLPIVLEPQSIMLKVEIGNKAIRRVSFVPVLMDAQRTPEFKSLQTREGLEIANLMRELSSEFGTELAFESDEVLVWPAS
jgi:poly-gamma-glutamate capsule biosynthesis protein CapA/YwtB (metallophosphatase superfamily)